MRNILKTSGSTFVSLFVLVVLGTVVYASDSSAVNYGASQGITAHGVCRKITNNSGTGLAVYVPTITASEWQSFQDYPPAGVSLSSCGGSQYYDTPGTYTFTAPAHSSLTVEVWGGGGGGENCYTAFTGGKFGSYSRFCWGGNTAGAASSFNGVVANGGKTGDGAAGGTATGGDVNLSGENAGWCGGSVYQYCGGGGNGSDPVATRHGIAPGGGGDGYDHVALTYGGGGGGYAKKTWGAGVLTPGATYTVIVGAGGANAAGNGAAPGAPGAVKITWE